MITLELDEYEQDIEDNFERHSVVPNQKEEIEKLKKAAIQHQKRKDN